MCAKVSDDMGLYKAPSDQYISGHFRLNLPDVVDRWNGCSPLRLRGVVPDPSRRRRVRSDLSPDPMPRMPEVAVQRCSLADFIGMAKAMPPCFRPQCFARGSP